MEELPKISDGKSPEEICEAVLRLNKIAKNLRQKRFDHGALRLDQPKLSFILDSDKRTPLGCAIYDIKDSNRQPTFFSFDLDDFLRIFYSDWLKNLCS